MDEYVFDDREEMILKNEGLIHSIIQRTFHFYPVYPDYYDLVSIGMIGLIKAVNDFDKSKDTKFSTYAGTCIFNEIAMYFRQNNKHSRVSSFEDIVKKSEKDGRELTVADILEDSKSNFLNNILIKTEFISMINAVLNFLEGTERIVMLYWSAGYVQRQIGDILGFCQNYISRILTKAIKKIRDCMNNNSYYEKIISFSIVDDEYVFVFPISYYDDFYSFFGKVVIDNVHQQVIIKLAGNVNSLAYIARFFLEIYKIASKNKRVSKPGPRKNSVPKEKKAVDKNEKIVYGLVFREDSSSKKITEYILSLDSFTVTEIRNHFRYEYTYYNIVMPIKRLVKYNIVVRTGRGQYKVIGIPNIQKD